MAEPTTIGRLMVKRALPTELDHYADRPMTSDQAQQLFTELAEQHPDDYPDVLKRLSDIARTAETTYGGETSLGEADIQIPPAVRQMRDKLQQRVMEISQNSALDGPEKNRRIVKLMRGVTDRAVDLTMKEALKQNNAFAAGILHGYRGKPRQLAQILFGDILMTNNRGEAVPVPGLHGYAEGVSPLEYWAGSYGSRQGLAGVQESTVDAGFLAKQMSLLTNRMRVTGKDCGAADRGMLISGTDMLGRVLAQDAGGIPAGTVIREEHLDSLPDDPVLVRSLLTCEQPEGVCSRCAGAREDGDLPPVGSHIGVASARTLTEPLTQAGLGSKHVGGQAEGGMSDLDRITQFFQVPATFRGKAALAPADGRVERIAKAPQGGTYIIVNSRQVYAAPGRLPQVQVGDEVEAGDALTDGVPKPNEVVSYKGIGEGRRYFADKLAEMLEAGGAGTHRRHVDAVTRAFINRVRITDPEGAAGYEPGELVSYSTIQRKYRPRSSAVQLSPSTAVGQYLEKPAAHYTIGTRITPRVAKELKSRGIKQVQAHKEPPGFEPEVKRLMDHTLQDPDWKVRMAGFNLQKGFLEAARHGSASPRRTSSYIPSLMNPVQTEKAEHTGAGR